MRTIELYIDGLRADVAQDMSILLTARVDDINNPSVVENPYTQQITLPPTTNNRAIFGFVDRADHRTTSAMGGVGVNFNAGKRTEFRLEIDGNICQYGYLKLDNTDRDGFHITLYGGLGALLYELSFDEMGEPLTLASLDYGYDLTHTISKESIRDAWAALANVEEEGFDYQYANKWGVINYAPCYDGIPSGFDANKQIIAPLETRQPAIAEEGGDTYAPQSGASVATYAKSYDGWDMKEFRSYLMRPVVSIGAVINAIKTYAENKGYTLNGFESYRQPLAHSWLTLPPLFGKNETTTTHTDSVTIASFNANGAGATSTGVTLPSLVTDRVRHDVTFSVGNVTASASQALYFNGHTSDTRVQELRAFVVQAVALDDDDNIVGESGAVVFHGLSRVPRGNEASLDEMLALNGIYAPMVASYDTYLRRRSGSTFEFNGYYNTPISFTFYSGGATRIAMRGQWIRAVWEYGNMFPSSQSVNEAFNSDGSTSYPISRVVIGATTDNLTITGVTIRSGAEMTQEKLLGSTDTPARYLVGMMRLCGYYLAPTGVGGKTFTLLSRGEYHGDLGIVYSLDGRVDYSKEHSIKPIAYDKRFYRFKYAEGKGAWIDEYALKYGETYGEMRTNTGYEFNTDTDDALDGIVFTNCADVLEQRDTFARYAVLGSLIPSPMMSGGKYTLYRADGESKQFDIVIPPSSFAPEWYNDIKGYDIEGMHKAQFHDADNKPTDQRNALLQFVGVTNDYAELGYFITDDNAVMSALNNGMPCWDCRSKSNRVEAVNVPMFQRAFGFMGLTLDIGAPKEYDDPTPREDVMTIYERYWQSYIADKYGADSQVMTAWVDLGNLPVPQDALRRQYTYNGNDWALVEMADYDLTGAQRFTKCTFVRVASWEAYGIATG